MMVNSCATDNSRLSVLFIMSLFCWNCMVVSAIVVGTKSSLPLVVLRGSAATPIDQKKNVVILGCGGYLGAITFGLLQRCTSLYDTGIGTVKCIGATADTAQRLNRNLSKHFILAFADESMIKLTDLSSIEAISQRLENSNALVLGSDMTIQQQPVTPGSYQLTPNDKAYEVYWDAPLREGSIIMTEEEITIKHKILANVLQAAKQAGLEHVIAVDSTTTNGNSKSILPLLQSTGIPYTCIQPPQGPLGHTQDWTFAKGLQSDLRISSTIVQSATTTGETTTTTTKPPQFELLREDLAAAAVQSLLSLDWSTSRTLQVTCQGILEREHVTPSGKRRDQEWCVSSHILEQALQSIP